MYARIHVCTVYNVHQHQAVTGSLRGASAFVAPVAMPTLTAFRGVDTYVGLAAAAGSSASSR